jgi:anti-sigma factor RsiW
LTDEQQIKLQAYLDGELSARAARRVERWLAADAEARALAGELRNTRQALAGNETAVTLPETRGFYWSKIEREVKRLETAKPAPAIVRLTAWLRGRVGILARREAPVASGSGLWWKRVLVPAVAVACLVMIVGVAVKQFGGRPGGAVGKHELVAALTDSGAITYRDDSTGVTLVWFSYPSQN